MAHIKDHLKLNGEVTITLFKADGSIREKRKHKNLVVNTGLAFIASRMKDTTKAAMTHMSVGSSTTAPSASDTDVISVLGSREAIDSTTVSGATITFISSFENSEGTGAVSEAAIHNASSGGDCLCRVTFPVVNKQADDSMNISWVITLSAS